MITFLLIPAILLTAFSRADFIPSDKICTTVFTSLKCVCQNREDVKLESILNEEINKITMKACRTVIVTFGAFNSLQLEELEFSDIDNLQFSAFSMSPIGGAAALKLENIANITIQPLAFVHVDYVAKISLINVTVDTLHKEAFSSISNIQHLLISKSHFHEVKPMAFELRNVTALHIIDSQFDSLYNNSIVISNSEKVQFENCSFSEMEELTFDISDVNLVSFDGCSFESLATKFIQTRNVEKFVIAMCTIENIKPYAFDSLEVEDRIIFENNRIQIAYPGSLDPFITPQSNKIKVEYCCNHFTCDCNMYWIWDYEKIPNAAFLKNSFCSEDKTKDLSLYTPVLDSYNNCMSLDFTPKSETEDDSGIFSELPIKLGGKNHASIETLNILLSAIVCCLIATELSSSILRYL